MADDQLIIYRGKPFKFPVYQEDEDGTRVPMTDLTVTVEAAEPTEMEVTALPDHEFMCRLSAEETEAIGASGVTAVTLCFEAVDTDGDAVALGAEVVPVMSC